MFRPTSDFIIIEKYEEGSRIALVHGSADNSDTFIVKDIGPGYMENGVRVVPDIQIGDKVALVGKILSIPQRSYNGNPSCILIARAGDVIAYERAEKQEPVFDEQIGKQMEGSNA